MYYLLFDEMKFTHNFSTFFFEEIKMGYINNGDESSLVQVVS